MLGGSRVSAGLVMYRVREGRVEVLLVHPGGPYFVHRDEGFWSIPKGIIGPGEAPLEAARREFEEETGLTPVGPFVALSPIRQRSGKLVRAWAFTGDCDPGRLHSNTFTIEWPPGSGVKRTFPEVDRAEFFDLAVARRKINPAQIALLDQLERSVLRAQS